MHKKQFYEAPDAELLVVRFEGNFCQTTLNNKGGIPDIDGDNVNDDSGLWGGNN